MYFKIAYFNQSGKYTHSNYSSVRVVDNFIIDDFEEFKVDLNTLETVYIPVYDIPVSVGRGLIVYDYRREVINMPELLEDVYKNNF